MPKTRKETRHDSTRDEIMATAWKQIGEQGAAALSLRGIAREMDLTAPALYYYFKDRDALVTALLVDAFNSFGQALEAGRNSCAADDHIGRFRALNKAYFNWGMKYPQRYTLLFGTPVQGYMLAAEVGPAAQSSFLVLQGVVGEAYTAGKISKNIATPELPTTLMSQYGALSKLGMPYSGIVTHLALSAWSKIHGMTSLYLDQYLNGFLANQVETFVDVEIENMIRELGIER
jgi:AcrR family transcriptional regulator